MTELGALAIAEEGESRRCAWKLARRKLVEEGALLSNGIVKSIALLRCSINAESDVTRKVG